MTGQQAEPHGVLPVDGVGREALIAYLRNRLPLAMVPTAFVLMESLPRLPNGKVDRRALPPPEVGVVSAEEAYVAPRTPTEHLQTDAGSRAGRIQMRLQRATVV